MADLNWQECLPLLFLVLFFFFSLFFGNGLYSKCKNKPSDFFVSCFTAMCCLCFFYKPVKLILDKFTSIFLLSFLEANLCSCVHFLCIHTALHRGPSVNTRTLGKALLKCNSKESPCPKGLLSQEVTYMIWGKGVTYLLSKWTWTQGIRL